MFSVTQQKKKKSKFSQLCCDCFNSCPPGSLLSQQRLNTVMFLMAKAWQECNLPPESSLLSLKSSSQAQGWPALNK